MNFEFCKLFEIAILVTKFPILRKYQISELFLWLLLCCKMVSYNSHTFYLVSVPNAMCSQSQMKIADLALLYRIDFMRYQFELPVLLPCQFCNLH